MLCFGRGKTFCDDFHLDSSQNFVGAFAVVINPVNLLDNIFVKKTSGVRHNCWCRCCCVVVWKSQNICDEIHWDSSQISWVLLLLLSILLTFGKHVCDETQWGSSQILLVLLASVLLCCGLGELKDM